MSNTKLHILCYHCEARCTGGDYCYGCNEVICDACEQTEIIGSGHTAEEHLSAAGKRVRSLLNILRTIQVIVSYY